MQAKIITVSQQKGGCGKTTITAQLSVALSQLGFKVAIIDTDPQASLSHWYNIREKKYGKDNTGLLLIATNGWRLNNSITDIYRSYDYILIDNPPHSESDTKVAIRLSDLVLIPLQPSPTDLWAISPTIEICIKESKNFRIILNRTTPHNKFIKEVSPHISSHLLEHSLGNRIGFSSSFVTGEAIVEREPKSQASIEVFLILEEIQQILSKSHVKENIA